MQNIENTAFRFNEFEVDPQRRLLLKQGETVNLNPKAFDLLLVLLENRGKILTKNELLETVWSGQFVEENNLTVHISSLRKILGEKKDEHQFIVTVPGKGYKFVGELNGQNETEVIVETHQFEKITVAEELKTQPNETQFLPPKPRQYLFLAGLICLLILAGIGVWIFQNRSAVNAPPIESIAVMPFVYEGGNAENEYLSDGMTESLINNLSQLPKLTVKARNSVFHYKGKPFDANKIGNELSVQAVLLGRIVERGGNFILSLELVDAKTNNQLWGEQYISKPTNLAAFQMEIARDVSNKLRQKLTGSEALQKGQTDNAEAYQLYLKGRFLWNKRKHNEHLKAIAMFEQAIALDPKFALAYAGLGDVYTVDSFRETYEVRNAKGRAAALKALEIEPNLGEAYTILAKVEWNAFNWQESEKYFKRAIELNPNYASVHQWYAEFLLRKVRIGESTSEIKRALELDPISQIINSDAAYIYTMARQEDKALAQANKLLELDASWYHAYEWRAAAQEAKRNYAEAIADFEKASELSNRSDEKKAQVRNEYRQVRQAFEKYGEKGYWQKSLEIVKTYPPSETDYYFIAVCYAKLHDKENALSSLEKSFENKEDRITLIKVEPFFDNLKSEPRFQAILRKINLAD